MLVTFTFFAAVQFTFGIVLIVLSRGNHAGEDAHCGDRDFRELIFRPRTAFISPFGSGNGMISDCILDFAESYYWPYRLIYTCFSLGYGQDVPPLDLLCVSKPSYHRYCITPYCDSIFSQGMRTEIDLADSSEDTGQRFGTIFFSRLRVEHPGGGYVPDTIPSSRVSLPSVFHPQNAH